MRAGAISVAVIITLFGGLAYLELSPDQKPLPTSPPVLPAVSSCREPGPGMRRIGGRQGFQFDVPLRDFTVAEWATDAGGIHGFDIKRNNSTADLNIWFECSSFPVKPPDPILALYDRTEKRKVLDETGNTVGQDSWGHWGQNERWRDVYLRGCVNARYGSKNEREVPRYGSIYDPDATLLDQIINSACRLPSTGE